MESLIFLLMFVAGFGGGFYVRHRMIANEQRSRYNAASLLDHLNKRPPCGPAARPFSPGKGAITVVRPCGDRKKTRSKFAHVIEIEAVVENDGRAILGC